MIFFVFLSHFFHIFITHIYYLEGEERRKRLIPMYEVDFRN